MLYLKFFSKVFVLLLVCVCFSCCAAKQTSSSEVIIYSSKTAEKVSPVSDSFEQTPPPTFAPLPLNADFFFDLSKTNWAQSGVIKTNLPEQTIVKVQIDFLDSFVEPKTISQDSTVQNGEISFSFSASQLGLPENFVGFVELGVFNAKDGAFWVVGVPSSAQAFDQSMQKINASYNSIITDINFDSENNICTLSLAQNDIDKDVAQKLENEVQSLLLKSQLCSTNSKFIFVWQNKVVFENNSQSSPEKTSENKTVWVSKTGKKYHYLGCKIIKPTSSEITFEQANSRGYTLCKICEKAANVKNR